MAQRAHSLFRPLGILVVLLSLAGCTREGSEREGTSSSFPSDTVTIPADTVLSTHQSLKLDNGLYYYRTRPYSGYIKGVYANDSVQFIGGCYNGRQHGRSVSYYPSGQIKDIRMYRANKSYGVQRGYWANGNRRFEFNYVDDKREGLQKQWYESGQPYAFLTYTNDREDGMQRAWRENGKAYINYEVRYGIRYGLQKSALCYTLEKEKFK
jgi:antitoxin component YwqK of YwqJK toxin-antitoxin module